MEPKTDWSRGKLAYPKADLTDLSGKPPTYWELTGDHIYVYNEDFFQLPSDPHPPLGWTESQSMPFIG